MIVSQECRATAWAIIEAQIALLWAEAWLALHGWGDEQ